MLSAIVFLPLAAALLLLAAPAIPARVARWVWVAVAAADMLASISQEPQPALLFPGSDDDARRGADSHTAQLTFLSTKGIVLPDPDTRPEFWGDEARQGVAISFWQFTRYGLVVTVATLIPAWVYVWLRYYAFG